MTTIITPILTNFIVASRDYGSVPFELINPVSTNTNSAAIFTFTSSNTAVADISGRTVTILSAGQAVITATQLATFGYSSATISANFTVNLATPTITGFTIAPKSLNDISFGLTAPSSNSQGAFTFRSLTTDVVSVSGLIATILRVGRARIEAIQFPATNYKSGTVIAEFDVLTSIVRVGVQNQIDLSWNIPIQNGATIKNYFFYVEERTATTVPAPPVSTMVPTVSPTNGSYYSYALPTPYSAQILSAGSIPTGIDVNSTAQFNINTALPFTNKNYFDLGYYGEIEISWEYHNDKPIVELNPNLVASTTVTLSLWKESSAVIGDGRVNFILSKSRVYDSDKNCLGPRPQNNNKTITDIYDIVFDSTATRALKYLKPTDIVSGTIQLSSISYSANDINVPIREYSIIVKSVRISPFRFPITRDFTTLGFGLGSSAVGAGFVVSTVNASAPLAPEGILYHMPKMTRSLTDYNRGSWSFSLNYAANLTRLETDISFLPVSGGLITNLNIPYTLRIRGYSRPYIRFLTDISVEEYNTTDVAHFLTSVTETRYNTRLLFDVSLNDVASYSQLSATTAPVITRTFDVSGVSGFPPFSETQDTSHTQFVFLFNLTITDNSYNQYFQTITASNANDAFQVKMLSQTMTPHQEYRFAGPDPTLASSNELTSMTNTLYTIANPYTNILPFYRFYNLTNGVFYSYKIASNNIVGTSAFSELFTRRCGSVPNAIVNTVNSVGTDTLTIESESTSNQVNIYWVKPSFSGYEIQFFVIQMAIDISGSWLNILDYTPDISHNLITFNEFQDTVVPIGVETQLEYNKTINTYTYKSPAFAAAFTQNTGIPIGVSGSLINGYKYYFRLASVNELGYSAYSVVLTGIPFARPANAPVQFVSNPIVGDRLVYLTWRIPQDDAGSPILNYIIDYEEVSDTTGAYSNKRRYKLDIDEPLQNIRPSYPFDDFRTVYAGYKNFDTLTSGEKTRISDLRSLLTKYIIPPTPITIDDSDAILKPSSIPNRNVLLSYDSRTFTFISAELTQNVFDISNIQLKWYYFSDPTGESWIGDATTVSFRMSLRGHLKAVSGSGAQDISNIFYINDNVVYTVTRAKLGLDDLTGAYKYINYTNGNIITDDVIPKIFIPTLPSVDASNNSRRYHLQINYEITYISPSPNKFLLYSGPIVINGTAPVRTRAGMNTKFTLKLQSNVNSPLVNGKKYRFTITPFNINDYFPDPSNNNRVELRIGINNSDPITDMSYSLISTSQGGKVRLQWNYSPPSDYYINIQIPRDYQNANFPPEYPLKTTTADDVTYSILVTNLTPVSRVVSYTIPSELPADIASGNAQLYLKSGRGYSISVSPVQIVEVSNRPVSLVAPARNMFADGTYIIPFRTPLSPLSLSALGNNGLVNLKWVLPDITQDPNYYITDITSSYYRYRYYTVEHRDISASMTAPWVLDASNIEIPTRDNGGVPGYETAYTISGLTNENTYQFRVRLLIINDYNGQRAFSEWTYMSSINNIAVPESSENSMYPSAYPYKPSAPLLRFASRTTSASGTLNVLTVLFVLPIYNGNADFYECEIFYTPVGSFGTNWYNIFDASNGIADTSFNNVLLSNKGKIETSTAVPGTEQRLNVVCRTTVLSYGIRIRVIGRKTDVANYPYTLYSDDSTVDYIEI